MEDKKADLGKTVPEVVVLNSHGVGQYVHVPRMPLPGETIRGWGWVIAKDGGKGSNVAIALGKLGVKAAFIGKVGNDLFGDLGEQWMSEVGVDVSCMIKSSEISTGTGLIMIDENGMNSIVGGGSSGRALTFEEVEQNIQKLQSSPFFVTGFEIPEEIALYGAKLAKGYGMTTIVNPSPSPIHDMGVVDYIDYLILNEIESKAILNLDYHQELPSKELAKRIQDRYKPQCVLITLGGRGCVGLRGSDYWEVSPLHVKTVDTTGAGDGFLAAFTANLSWGRSVREATEWANVYSAYTTTIEGTIPAYPTLEEIQRFMLENRKK